VPIEHASDGIDDRLTVIHEIAGNLPEPAAIEVARRFLHRGVEQQEHNAFSPSLKDPYVEDVRSEMHVLPGS
jgi:hypothetical protein